MESTQSCIGIFVVEIDGSSHQQESGISYINTFCHFLVQISNNSIPVKTNGENLGVFRYLSQTKRSCPHSILLF